MSTSPDDLPPLPVPPSPAELFAVGPLGALLSVMETQPGLGWTLKEAEGLRLVAHRGQLPHLDTSVVGGRTIRPGATEAELFEKHQAMLLRLSDLRALTQSRVGQEIHHFEAEAPVGGDGVREWTAWRWPIGGGEQPRWLLTVWFNRRITSQFEEPTRQLQRQLHAQQMLINELRADPSGWHAPERPAAAALGEDFVNQLRREVDLSRREHRNLAVLLVEVDVRRLSPSGARTAVALVSRQLSTGVRTMDTVVQIGQNRFGVLLSGAALTPAHARAEAMRRAAATQVVVDGGAPHPLTVSIGVGAYPHSARGLEDLMRVTLAALEEAATDGIGRSVVARVVLEEPPLG